jgi:hypothetical protein
MALLGGPFGLLHPVDRVRELGALQLTVDRSSITRMFPICPARIAWQY